MSFEISKPEAITKVVEGQLMNRSNLLIIHTTETNIGILTEILSNRQASTYRYV